jgi:hypothetical protein
MRIGLLGFADKVVFSKNPCLDFGRNFAYTGLSFLTGEPPAREEEKQR